MTLSKSLFLWSLCLRQGSFQLGPHTKPTPIFLFILHGMLPGLRMRRDGICVLLSLDNGERGIHYHS